MAISLGRESGLTWGGIAVPGVRDVTVDYAVTTIEARPFGSRHGITFPTGYAVTLTVDTIDDAAASTAVAASIAGTEIAVVAGGYSFTAIVTGVTDSAPLDGVRAYSIQMAKTQAGLR